MGILFFLWLDSTTLSYNNSDLPGKLECIIVSLTADLRVCIIGPPLIPTAVVVAVVAGAGCF